MADSNVTAVPLRHTPDIDEITKKARQLHALFMALSTPTDDTLSPTTVSDALWLAMDLAEGIFEAAVGFPLALQPAGCQCEVHDGTH
jgi:hypothetical protein